MKKYKNISKKAELLIGVGIVQPGEVVETDVEVHNENFTLVIEEDKKS